MLGCAMRRDERRKSAIVLIQKNIDLLVWSLKHAPSSNADHQKAIKKTVEAHMECLENTKKNMGKGSAAMRQRTKKEK